MTNEELTKENEELKKWKAGAERLLENYVKLIFDKDDRSYKMQQELKATQKELNEIKEKHTG